MPNTSIVHIADQMSSTISHPKMLGPGHPPDSALPKTGSPSDANGHSGRYTVAAIAG